MEVYRTEGVILQTINFQDYDQIISLFTENEGIIKLVVKGARHSKRHQGANIAPLAHAEVVYAKGRSELYQCREITILHPHLNLRNNLPVLTAACDMLQALLSSQQVHEPAPALYALLNYYLDKISAINDPHIFSASFRLKILRHEGLLDENCHEFILNLAYCRTLADIAHQTLTPSWHETIIRLFDEQIHGL